MKRMGRAESVVKNLKFTAACELILALLKFVSRKAFVFSLGKEYLGISGLFTDILSLLSLAELGFSTSITYSLYRPVAQEDTERVKSLMQLYRRVYQIVGSIVFAAGLSLVPFLGFFIKEMPENVPHIPLIYILNVLNASISYFFVYKSTLLFVYQKKYIDAMIRTVVMLATTAAQIAALLLTQQYILYLLLGIGATLVQNAAVSAKADRLYPFLKEKNVRPLPAEVLREIRRNVGAMVFHRIGAVAVFSTDNILISKFVGITMTGLYSNYIMIRSFLNVMINTLFNAITPALGNLNATETDENKQLAFSRLDFFSAWLFGWMSVCLLCLYDPFISLWLGKGYLLPRTAVLLIVANFYVTSMRIPVMNTKGVLGLFWDDRYKPILETLLNLIVSVILAQKWGIVGILAGTLINTIAIPFWVEPLVLCRRGLKLSVKGYFKRYFAHLLVTAAAGALTELLCHAADGHSFSFLLRIIFCMIVPHIIYWAVYHRTSEFYFLKNTAKKIVHQTICKI